jgi:hypothetical protein
MMDIDCMLIKALLLKLFIEHVYVPPTFMECMTVPLVECNTGNLPDVNCYRTISVISKFFEHVLSWYETYVNKTVAYQFGFTAIHSSSHHTYVLKSTADYHSEWGSHVFACYIGFSKAFDMVSYWKVFLKMLNGRCYGSWVETKV